MRAFITAISGPALTAEERRFLREAQPWGIILFTRKPARTGFLRNIESPGQVRRLIEEIRSTIGRAAPILVDQEGGRIQRLGPPQWPSYPPAAAYGRLYEHDRAAAIAAARLGGRLIAADLEDVGIDVDCMPVADVPTAGADPVVGDRAYGNTAGKVEVLAGAIAEGVIEGGVLPVMKHIPGHGRATADSHERLPVVDTDRATLENTDFAAFRGLNWLPLAMTAHVVFSAIDPVAPATTSATIVRDVIRDSIGFQNLLMSDDITMGALSGSLAERSRAALAAGCDLVLHCSGEMAEMEEIAAAAPALAGDSARRSSAALAMKRSPAPIDLAAARAKFFSLMAGVWEPAEGAA